MIPVLIPVVYFIRFHVKCRAQQLAMNIIIIELVVVMITCPPVLFCYREEGSIYFLASMDDDTTGILGIENRHLTVIELFLPSALLFCFFSTSSSSAPRHMSLFVPTTFIHIPVQ